MVCLCFSAVVASPSGLESSLSLLYREDPAEPALRVGAEGGSFAGLEEPRVRSQVLSATRDSTERRWVVCRPVLEFRSGCLRGRGSSCWRLEAKCSSWWVC